MGDVVQPFLRGNKRHIKRVVYPYRQKPGKVNKHVIKAGEKGPILLFRVR